MVSSNSGTFDCDQWLLSHTTFAADATIIQLGQMPNWNPPTQMSLQLLDSDQTTRTQVWAVAVNGGLCAYPADFNNHPSTFAIVTFSENAQLLLDDIQTKGILEKAIASQMGKCPASQYRRGSAVAVDKKISTIDSAFVMQAVQSVSDNRTIDGVLAQRRQGPPGPYYNDYFNKVATQHQNSLRAGQERQRQQMVQQGANQKLQVFVDNHGAKGWIKYDVLLANPFAAEGKAYLFNARFIRMLTPSSAIFGDSERGFVVSNIPNQLFLTPKAEVFVGRGLGTTNMKNQFGAEVAAPHVRFLQLICTEPNCADTLSANATFR